MFLEIASNIMRTTLDIDAPILEELKGLQAREKKSLGRLVSDLLAGALAARTATSGDERAQPVWIARPMQALVDLADKETVYAAMNSKEMAP